jgi:spermidine synthase
MTNSPTKKKQLTAPSSPISAFLLIAIIFIFSGATSLIYEVIWTRHLTTFFGSTLYGVATVLSAFMGGLALGSYFIGKRADKMKHPLVAYGLFEIGIGITALLFPYALKATQPIIGSFYVTGGENTFLVFSLIRFVIVFALLLIPTTLMGATLPVMSKAVTQNLAMVGKRVGGLYALNTAGACVGVFAAGFFLLENFGITQTTWIAVIIDIIIGVGAILIGRKYFLVNTKEDTPKKIKTGDKKGGYSPSILRIVLLSYGVSGFVALAYQVCWTRALIFSFDTLKSTTYSFSGMLLVFLLGLTIGSAIMQSFVDKQRNLIRLYALLQTGIGLGGGLSYFMLLQNPEYLEVLLPQLNADGLLNYSNAVLHVMALTAMTIGLPTLLMGMAFPVVTKIVVSSVDHLGGDVAKVYALNTVGAILGSFCAGFILIPIFGITGTISLLASINLLLGAFLFWINQDILPNQKYLMVGICLFAAILVPARILLSDSTLQRIQLNEKTIHYEEGAMATISVVENNSGERMIYVDDVGVAGTDRIMLTDQKSLAHVPMMLLGAKAENVLSVGFGSGGASFSYTLYPEIERISTIEIAPEVLRAAHTLTDSNHGILITDEMLNEAKASGATHIKGFRYPIEDYIHTPAPGFKTFDPRLEVLIDDARSYLRFTDRKYDVIATDCTDLRYKTNANLYDLEYFTLCEQAITDKGLVVVWMPLAGLSDRAFRSALRTFQVVFPEMSVWYFTNQPTHYCLLIGGKGPISINYEDVVTATTLPEVTDDLDEIALRDPAKLLSSFVCDERTLTDLLKDYPLNTEDHPIIEFESPRYGYDSRPLRDNQWKLFEVQVPASTLITNLPAGMADRIWAYQENNFVTFEGHCAYRLYDFKGAAKLYLKALEMAPGDVSVERLLNFRELRRHYDTSKATPSSNTLAIGLGLAEAYMVQGRLTEAVSYANQTINMFPAAPPEQLESGHRAVATGLYTILADAYKQNGNTARAKEFQAKAAEYSFGNNQN